MFNHHRIAHLRAFLSLGCGYQFGKAGKHAVDSVVVFAAEPARLRHVDDFIFVHQNSRETPAFRPGRWRAAPKGPYVFCVYNVRMIRANFFLPEPLLAALRELAQKTDLSVSEHVRRALAEYLKRQK